MTLAAGQYLVVASNSVGVAAGALVIRFALASDNVQNGASDGVALVNTSTGTLFDALSYEGAITAATLFATGSPMSLVEGTVLPMTVIDSNAVTGSLCRYPNGVDTNDASVDWGFCNTPTPGAANVQ